MIVRKFIKGWAPRFNKEGLKRRSTIRPAKITGKKLVWKTDPYGVDYISERAFSKKLNLHTHKKKITQRYAKAYQRGKFKDTRWQRGNEEVRGFRNSIKDLKVKFIG